MHGYDAAKKVNGRKRHLLVDTLGLLITVVVHAASVQDRDGAKLVIEKVSHILPRLRLIPRKIRSPKQRQSALCLAISATIFRWADGGYAGQLVEWVRDLCHWVLEIVKRSDDVKGFQVLPRRWVVERTLAWLGRYRRLSKDYEYLTESSEAMIYLAMTHIMVRRLARKPQAASP